MFMALPYLVMKCQYSRPGYHRAMFDAMAPVMMAANLYCPLDILTDDTHDAVALPLTTHPCLLLLVFVSL